MISRIAVTAAGLSLATTAALTAAAGPGLAAATALAATVHQTAPAPLHHV